MAMLQGSQHGLKILCFCYLGLVILSAATGRQADDSPVNITARAFSEIAVFPQHRAPAVVVPQNDSKINADDLLPKAANMMWLYGLLRPAWTP